MSGLSDSAWEELAAAIDGPEVAEPSPAEAVAPEALVQTEPESTAPDVIEDVPTEAVATEPVVTEPEPDPRLAEIEARERAVADAEAREAAKQRELAARWQQWQEQEAEKKSTAYYQQLVEENGQEVADQYMQMRQGVLQQRRDAESRASGAERGLTAAMIALEQVVSPEQFQQVLSLTENLVTLPDANQMQSAIQQERQRTQSANAEKTALEQTIRELRSQLDATSRPVNADAVGGGAGGPGHGARIEDAPDFDTFFGQLTGTLPAQWQ